MFKKFARVFAMKAHAARTITNDPLQKFMFRVTVPGLPSGIGFQKVGGLTREVGVTEYLEGLYTYTHKLPGREKVSEVTLERGSYADKDFENLYKKVLTNPDIRNTLIIEILDRFGNTKRTYKLAEAWVSKWEGSDLDASSDDVAIEKLTVQFEYFLD
jgi:phage tail-like protein